jgi:hypothetical protein
MVDELEIELSFRLKWWAQPVLVLVCLWIWSLDRVGLRRWIDGEAILGWFVERVCIYEVNGKRIR